MMNAIKQEPELWKGREIDGRRQEEGGGGVGLLEGENLC